METTRVDCILVWISFVLAVSKCPIFRKAAVLVIHVIVVVVVVVLLLFYVHI